MFTAFSLVLISLFANTLSALAGGGAGLLQLPALIFLGLPFGTALATHKLATIALGVGAGGRHLRNQHYQLPMCLLILAAGVPGVLLGAYWVLSIPSNIAQFSLGVLTVSLGIYSFSVNNLGQIHAPKALTLRRVLIGGLGIFIVGVLNGSLSSGTGLLLTVWLIMWFGFDYKHAIAYTMLVVGLAWNAVGAVVLGTLGEIKWAWMPALIVGSLLGGYAGAHLSIVKGNRLIKRLFEALTLLTGFGLIIKSEVWGYMLRTL